MVGVAVAFTVHRHYVQQDVIAGLAAATGPSHGRLVTVEEEAAPRECAADRREHPSV